ncbi:MAG: alanine racemase [Clostridiales bacterium]|nr:alanine racemase [Clostridiales bacterium]
MSATRVIVDLSAIERNIGFVRQGLGPETGMIAVVKANAYGHGMFEVARRALGCGVSMLAVATDAEGAQLREAGIGAPVLVLGGLLPQCAPTLLKHRLIPAVYTSEMIYALSKAAAPDRAVPIHIKIETGMNRSGARPGRELSALLEALWECPRVRLTGMFSHFAAAEEADDSFTRRQYDVFRQAAEQAREAGFSPRLHIGNSAAAMRHAFAHMDWVRLGIVMYGLDPAGDANPNLQPALSWITRIVCLKRIEAGETVGYGRTYTATGPRTIATLPVGYADGYRRAFGGRADVLIGGRRAPVVGLVCMDQCMADVSGIPGVKVGDEAVLLGKQADEEITAGELAAIAHTIHYEIVTCIGPRIPRIHHG